MDDVFTQEVSITAEEFAEAVDKLISAAREGGLSDEKMIVVLEDTVEGWMRDCRPLRISAGSSWRGTRHRRIGAITGGGRVSVKNRK
jgi:hypothetical protein